MKKLFIVIFKLFVICLMVGCNDDKGKYDDIILGDTRVDTHGPYYVRNVSINGGSGDFSVTIAPEIAEVSIDSSDESEQVLIIVTQKIGEAVITVKDKKSGKKAKCLLTVTKPNVTPAEWRYAVDAEQKEAIEAELAVPPYPAGSFFYFDPSFLLSATTNGEWKVVDPESWKMLAAGGFFSEDKKEIPSYLLSLLPINQQILDFRKINIELDNGQKVTYYTFVVQSVVGSGNSSPRYAHLRYYEDLTGYFQNKYPEAGVNAVVRAYIYGAGYE